MGTTTCKRSRKSRLYVPERECQSSAVAAKAKSWSSKSSDDRCQNSLCSKSWRRRHRLSVWCIFIRKSAGSRRRNETCERNRSVQIEKTLPCIRRRENTHRSRPLRLIRIRLLDEGRSSREQAFKFNSLYSNSSLNRQSQVIVTLHDVVRQTRLYRE